MLSSVSMNMSVTYISLSRVTLYVSIAWLICLTLPGLVSSYSDINIDDNTNRKNIQRKEVWVPIKNKHTEFDEEYKTGVWNETVQDTSFPSGFSQLYAVPIERMRLAVIAGVYFQMYPRDNDKGTLLDVGCGRGLMANYLMPGQVSRYTGNLFIWMMID
jgi:hypothetical protein